MLMKNQNINYKFEIDKVGTKTVNQFIGVVCEIRYNFIGSTDNYVKSRQYIQPIDTSNLNVNTFKPLPEITKDELIQWLTSSINPINFQQMKQAIYEQLYPEVLYFNIDYFKDRSGS